MVWDREHVESMSPEEGVWENVTKMQIPDGLTARVLSRDKFDGAVTVEVRLPAGWQLDSNWSFNSNVDFLMLEGLFLLGEDEFVRYDFSYRPAGFISGPLKVVKDSMMIMFIQGNPAITKHNLEASNVTDHAYRDAIVKLPALSVTPRLPLTDREEKPNIFSRTLRLNTITGERIFITGATEGSTEAQRGDPRVEWHECVEEIYTLESWVSMDHPQDNHLLKPGWYCYRPGGIPHGPFAGGPATQMENLFRVSGTLTNNYVNVEEAKRLWTDFPADSLDPDVKARIGHTLSFGNVCAG